MLSAGLVLDIVLLGAIGAAMWRAWILSRQFEQAKADRAAFEQLISALNIAAGRAEAAVEALRAAATEAGDGLQSKVNAARALQAELEIMLEAGDNLAERLQNAASQSRGAPAEKISAPDPEKPAASKTAAPRTRAEKELLDALRAKQEG